MSGACLWWAHQILDMTEERINELEDRPIQLTGEEYKENNIKQKIEDLWDNYRRYNICIIRMPGEEYRPELKIISAVRMVENFPRWRPDPEPHIQRVQSLPNRAISKIHTYFIPKKNPRPRDNLEEMRATYRSKKIIIFSGLLRNCSRKRELTELCDVLKEKNLTSLEFLLVKLSFTSVGELVG